MSIVIAILATSSESSDMSEDTHRLALEYLASILSIRDRKEIIRIFCKVPFTHIRILSSQI